MRLSVIFLFNWLDAWILDSINLKMRKKKIEIDLNRPHTVVGGGPQQTIYHPKFGSSSNLRAVCFAILATFSSSERGARAARLAFREREVHPTCSLTANQLSQRQSNSPKALRPSPTGTVLKRERETH
jgi:hypothetical protein